MVSRGCLQRFWGTGKACGWCYDEEVSIKVQVWWGVGALFQTRREACVRIGDSQRKKLKA